MRTRKAVVFDELRHRYAQLRDQQWGGKGWYDPFFGAPLNNARLLPFGLYDDQIPAFEELFAESGRDWRRFFDAASRSEERRVGKDGVSTCGYRWPPDH